MPALFFAAFPGGARSPESKPFRIRAVPVRGVRERWGGEVFDSGGSAGIKRPPAHRNRLAGAGGRLRTRFFCLPRAIGFRIQPGILGAAWVAFLGCLKTPECADRP